MDSAALYRAMADSESSPSLAEVYRRLALVEDKHAIFWRQRLKEAGASVEWKPSLRTRLLRWLAHRFGPQIVAHVMSATESAGQTMYDNQPESKTTELPRDERSHARILAQIAGSAQGGIGGNALARMEGRHRAIGGNALRAAVLGANDGLLSNLSLIMGVAGAEMSTHSIAITGIAGLLAGACSMAIGEWVSVQSSRELNERQIAIEADELAAAPEDEEEELRLIYQAKGLPENQAKALAENLIKNPLKALETLTREELGINPEELGGSSWEAALASFFLFACGAAVPLLPFFFLQGAQAVIAGIALSALGLVAIGGAITMVTGRSFWVSAARQLAMGSIAAAITYTIGHWLGVSLGG